MSEEDLIPNELLGDELMKEYPELKNLNCHRMI